MMVGMEQKFTKNCQYALIVIVLSVGVFAIATNNNLVAAQTCTAQLGSPTTSIQQYFGANFQVTLPVTAYCPFYSNQLYAVGTAYDTAYNSNVATANTNLSPTYGGTSFSGQLQFNLPNSAEYHSVQFSVSIYNAQNGYGYPYYGGGLLTTTSATFVVGPNTYQNYPYYSTYPTYPTYPSYPVITHPSFPNCPYYPSYSGYPHYPSNYYHMYGYCYPNSGYYYYYRNPYYSNNNNYYCNPSRSFCSHH
jgi:hypothetical protein